MRASLERLGELLILRASVGLGSCDAIENGFRAHSRFLLAVCLQPYSSRVIFMFAQAIGDDGGDNAMDMTINESRR